VFESTFKIYICPYWYLPVKPMAGNFEVIIKDKG